MAAPRAFLEVCAQLCCSAANASCLLLPMAMLMPAPAPQNINKSSPQAGLERPRAEGGRELLRSPSRTYPEALWLRFRLLVSYRPLAVLCLNFQTTS